jgi:PPM family protein phosphatase
MTLVLRYAVRSDVGLLREGNEDSAYAGPRLLAVADGMGGHAAGEVASALTIAAMAELDDEPPGGDMLQELAAAVAAANSRLQDKILANPAVEGMGTTLTALLWSDGHAAVCHIGDSRGYLLRDGELYQITHDHTLVQSLVDEGRISADDVSTHPQRSLLLRALDGRSVAEPDLSVHDSMPGDRYLLCSDGLSGVVSDETLRDTLSDLEDLDAATRQLIDLAIHGGGPDNITCIVADVVDQATSQLPPTTTPILAGAAVSLGDLRSGADGTNGLAPVDHADTLDSLAAYDGLEDHHDDHRPARTAPQQAVTDDLDPRFPGDITIMASQNGTAPGGLKTVPGDPGRRSHRAQPRRTREAPAARGRRRWPIVTTSLVVLLAVIIGGGYIAWRWTQDQYYVAANNKGQVVIYRGINQKIAGVSLSSPYRQTTLQLDQVPSNYQQIVKTAYATGSLAQVQRTVGNISAAVKLCQQQYAALAAWQTKDKAYLAAVAAAQKIKNKKTTGIPKPGPQPPDAGATCPPPGVFGIPASALPPGAS